MGAFSIGSISESTAEDFIDEGVSNLVYGIGNCYFGGANSSTAGCSKLVESSFAEALDGASQTLKFSIMNAVIMRVTEYALTRLLAGGGLLYLWIKKRRVINAIKETTSSLISVITFVGKSGAKAFDGVVNIANGNQAENLAVANMANTSMNSVTHILAQERQTATIQVNAQRKQLMTSLGLSQNSKGLNDTKKMEIYLYKMKTGTWEVTTNDKRLFDTVVPKSYRQKDYAFNLAFVQKLNSFTEYAKTTENKLVNLAQTHLDLMTASNLSKVK
jgi:heat shock protein HslJ